MSFSTIGDSLKATKSREVNPAFSEVAIFKQLIKERVDALDLVRELLSNAGAEQVGATKIEISYTQDQHGHIFEVTDDGCGMYYTGNEALPGRLDRFLGLGLSGIVGHETDEFSWKGLGSKLAYQSRKVEIETCAGSTNPMYDVRINEPWDTLEHNNLPKPRIGEYPTQGKGTKIRVIGHPPHRKEEPFTFDQIRTYLLHRTFVGFTRQRKNVPQIVLSVLGRTEPLNFGFPEFSGEGLFDQELNLDEAKKTLFVNVAPKSHKSMPVRLKGFVTWDHGRYKLSADNLNVGLILSVKGIPYFPLNMEEYGSTTIRTARPGEGRTCLIVECDAIQNDMNISRSGLVDSPQTLELRKIVKELFQHLESSQEFLKFRLIPERDKVEIQGGILKEQKRKIELADQNWVVLERTATDIVPLIRDPPRKQQGIELELRAAHHIFPQPSKEVQYAT